MARVRDLWTNADGTKTTKHPANGGNKNAKRWLAVWDAPGSGERTRAFAKKADAEQFIAMREKLRVRTELLASDGDGIDPSGWYVYLLWEVVNDDSPVYVGSSGNILSRLGDHLGNSSKRPRVGWVTLIRCTSEKAMLAREGELIRRYRPEWNKHIPAEPRASEAA